MTKRKAEKPQDPWSESVGERGSTIRVFENWNRGGSVYLSRTKNRQPVEKSLAEYLGEATFTIRDSKGQIVERLQRRAWEAAIQASRDLRLRIDPFGAAAASVDGQPPLDRPSLSKAFFEALRSRDGMFVRDTRHRQECIGLSEEILVALGDIPVDGVVPRTAESLWRFYLNQAKDVKEGRRKAEKAISCLYAVLRWLNEREPTLYPAPRPVSKWRTKIREAWEQRFDTKLLDDEDDQPRHSVEETRMIFRKLHDAPPSIQLMVEVCGEQRAGQVARATRKDLDLDASEDAPYGILDIRRHARGKKNTTIIVLHPEARALIDSMLMDGHLSELERAYQSGEIENYHLFPAGKLRKGKMPVAKYRSGPISRNKSGEWVRSGPSHINREHLIKAFHRFERAIGITPVKGRAFYGLRRVLSDLAEDQTTDTRVLRELTGWKSEEMRKHYQKRRNPEVLARASETRTKIRDGLRAGQAAAVVLNPATHLPIDLENLSMEQLQALHKAVEARFARDSAAADGPGE
jgi:hypothetical protein